MADLPGNLPGNLPTWFGFWTGFYGCAGCDKRLGWHGNLQVELTMLG